MGRGGFRKGMAFGAALFCCSWLPVLGGGWSGSVAWCSQARRVACGGVSLVLPGRGRLTWCGTIVSEGSAVGVGSDEKGSRDDDSHLLPDADRCSRGDVS